VSTDKPSRELLDRMDDFAPHVTEGDYTTTPEALTVLREQGVDAWRTWCVEHSPHGR
jgi:hypothetical protein